MSAKNYPLALASTLEHEGGWSNHPDDPGGATFRGVTKKAWEAHVGRKVTNEELARLTFPQISEFYKKRYWDACRCDDLPAGVDFLVFDIAVNSGPYRAGIMLQTAINELSRAAIIKDGIIGPKTALAASKVDPLRMIDRIAFRRLTFYSSLRTYEVFKNGWRRRAVETATYATLIFCGHAAAVVNASA